MYDQSIALWSYFYYFKGDAIIPRSNTAQSRLNIAADKSNTAQSQFNATADNSNTAQSQFNATADKSRTQQTQFTIREQLRVTN